MMVGAFRLPVTILGMIEASTTRRPDSPCTRPWLSTTAIGSEASPILQVQDGCSAVSACSRTKASISASLCTIMPGLISRPRNWSSACWPMISRVRRTAARNSRQSTSCAM
ncbi:hypothetical protein D9M72_536700 [compost metagenome]